MAVLAIAALSATGLAGCEKPPIYTISQTTDQIAVCRDTEAADFQEAENVAAQFCASRGLLPRLAGTARCARKSVRYNYICVAPHY